MAGHGCIRRWWLMAVAWGVAAGQCDMREYKGAAGLRAEAGGGGVVLTWQGERGQELRAALAVAAGQPVVRELAVRRGQGAWSVLARELTPEFEVVSGKRRISEQQLAPLRRLGLDK